MARVKFVPYRPGEPEYEEGNAPGPSNASLQPHNSDSSVQDSVDGQPENNPQNSPASIHSSSSGLETTVSGILLLGPTTRNGRSQPALSTQVRTRPSVLEAGMQPIMGNSQQEVAQEEEIQRPRRSKRQRTNSPISPAAQERPNLLSNAVYGVGRPDFNVFQGILLHVHIIFHFIHCLEIDDLVSLYAISRDFHDVIDASLTAVILAKATQYAPTAAVIFPFRCYRKLCVDDPLVEVDRSRGQSRMVPSFRWLRMVCWREQIAKKIHFVFNNEGLWLPRECEPVIKKVWFLMDIPDNQRRIATIQNHTLWTTSDLFHAIMFFMRIDMRCSNPIIPTSRGSIRRMLLAQPTMSMIYRVLIGTWLRNTHECLQTYLRWKYTPVDREYLPIFGVQKHEMGRLQYEGYGVGGSSIKLQRPDELVLKECVRRGLNVEPIFFGIANATGPVLEMD